MMSSIRARRSRYFSRPCHRRHIVPRVVAVNRRVALTRAIELEQLETRRLLATTFTVTTAADESIVNGTTSLREAVALANATNGADTINFSAAAFPSGSLTTINLTAGP